MLGVRNGLEIKIDYKLYNTVNSYNYREFAKGHSWECLLF